MIVTTKLRYALDFLVALAHHDPAEPLSLREVAEISPASEKYLESIAGELRRSGIVVSRKGKKGGYFLGRPPGEITILQIVDACDPELLTPDTGGRLPGSGDGTRGIWVEVTEGIRRLLDGYRLSDVVDGRFAEGQVLHYVI